MPAKYRKISPRIWGDEHFSALAPPANPSAQFLFIYILTGPHTTAFPGLARLTEAELWNLGGVHPETGEPVWKFKDVHAAVAEIENAKPADRPLLIVDRKARAMYLPGAIGYNPPESPNVVIAWAKAWADMPECSLRNRATADAVAYLEAKGKAFIKAFIENLPEALPEVLPEARREPSPNQEQVTGTGIGEREDAPPQKWNINPDIPAVHELTVKKCAALYNEICVAARPATFTAAGIIPNGATGRKIAGILAQFKNAEAVAAYLEKAALVQYGGPGPLSWMKSPPDFPFIFSATTIDRIQSDKAGKPIAVKKETDPRLVAAGTDSQWSATANGDGPPIVTLERFNARQVSIAWKDADDTPRRTITDAAEFLENYVLNVQPIPTTARMEETGT